MSNRPSARHRRCPDPGRNEQPSEAACQAALGRYRLGDQDPCGLRGRPGRPDPCPLPGPNTGKGVTGLIKRLGSLGVAGVAIERSDGPLVEAMLEPTCAWSWSPRGRSRAYAAGIGPAGPSPIPPTPTCWLRCWGPTATAWPRSPRQRADQDPAGAVAHPQRPRRARVALVNQLTSQLEGCCPGAIGLFQELHSPTAVAFLGRYPTSHAAATLTQATLAALLRRLHYSGRTPASELLRRLQTAPAAGISPAEAAGRAVWVLARLDAIQVTSRQERELEAELIERLEVHADQHIFTSLARAGHGVRAAAPLAELGDVRARLPTEEA